MSLSAGIVGLPNVGKSTLFNALLKRQIALAANYPFATIDPNTGIVPVPDLRLEQLALEVKTQNIKPATMEFVDIAGLVKGASQGEGLGNQFLAHIREVDLICHVIRGFNNSEVVREGSVDPFTDRETIETELLLADLSTLEKQVPPKDAKDKVAIGRWQVIEQFLVAANQGQAISAVCFNDQHHLVARELGLLTSKPVLYLVNIDEQQLAEYSSFHQKYADLLRVPIKKVVLISARVESELAVLDDEDQKAFLSDLGVAQSSLERLIKIAYQELGLQSFLTAGEKEVRAWTIKSGMTAVQAAGVIHTDFSKKFIKAKVTNYDDFVVLGGWKGVRESGKLRLEGRDYVMQEGDVVEFMIGA